MIHLRAQSRRKMRSSEPATGERTRSKVLRTIFTDELRSINYPKIRTSRGGRTGEIRLFSGTTSRRHERAGQRETFFFPAAFGRSVCQWGCRGRRRLNGIGNTYLSPSDRPSRHLGRMLAVVRKSLRDASVFR